MIFPKAQILLVFLSVVAISLVTVSAFAQNNDTAGKLNIHVTPKQAYVFVDGKAKDSTHAFPNDASDARILWQRAEPSLRKVELAVNSATTGKTLQAGTKQNH